MTLAKLTRDIARRRQAEANRYHDARLYGISQGSRVRSSGRGRTADWGYEREGEVQFIDDDGIHVIWDGAGDQEEVMTEEEVYEIEGKPMTYWDWVDLNDIGRDR